MGVCIGDLTIGTAWPVLFEADPLATRYSLRWDPDKNFGHSKLIPSISPRKHQEDL